MKPSFFTPPLLLCFLFCTPPVLWGQSDYTQGLKQLEDRAYADAARTFRELSAKNSVLGCLGQSKCYLDPGNPAFSLDSAYALAVRAEQALRKMEPKEAERTKKFLEPDSPVRQRRLVEKKWFEDAMNKKTVAALDHFLNTVARPFPAQTEAATGARNQGAFDEAAQQNTTAAYALLLSRYGESLKESAPELFRTASFRLFERYTQENGWAAQDRFAALFPQAAWARDVIAADFAASWRTRPSGWERFIQKYPGTPYAAAALDSLGQFLVQSGTWKLCRQYLQTYPEGPHREAVWAQLYADYRRENPAPSALKVFSEQFSEFPFPARIAQDQTTAVDFFYRASMDSDSLARMKRFLSEYPNYPKADSLWQRYYTRYRASAAGPRDLDLFIQQHPECPQAMRESIREESTAWQEQLEKEAFERIVAAGRPTPLFRYIQQEPPRPYRKQALEQLATQLTRSDSLEAIALFLEKYPTHALRKELLNRLYIAGQTSLSRMKIDQFAEKYPDFDPQRLKRDIEALSLSEEIRGKYSPGRWAVFSDYIQGFAPSESAFFLLQKMMAADFREERWAAVLDTLERYKPYFHNRNDEFDAFYAMFTQYGTLNSLKPLLLQEGTNYPEYSPTFSGDGKQFFFGRNMGSDFGSQEDIYFTEKRDSVWSIAAPLAELNTPRGNEVPLSVSANATEMMLFVSGDLYESRKTSTGWSTPTSLPAHINFSNWQCDARYTGKGIIYTASPGGNMDLYIAFYGPDGRQLQKPINLGPDINTSQDERAPFLHPDMKTMYFSSAGHDGFGELDIYVTTRLDDTWTRWSKPRNLGLLINSHNREREYRVSTSGDVAYLSAYRNGLWKIFETAIQESYRPEAVYTFETKLLDPQGKPINGEVIVQDLETGQIVQIVRPDPKTGAVFIPIADKKNLRAELKSPNSPPVSINLDLVQTKRAQRTEADIILPTTDELLKSGATLPINNIFFTTGSFTLLPESRFELDALAQYLLENKVKIEIHGHTDDVGSAESNQLLAENRANAVRAYLLKKGCLREHIRIRGFGESKPAVPNTNDEARAKNRRVEFKLW